MFRKATDIGPGDVLVIRSTLNLGGNWTPEVRRVTVTAVELYAGRVRIYTDARNSLLRRPNEDVEVADG